MILSTLYIYKTPTNSFGILPYLAYSRYKFYSFQSQNSLELTEHNQNAQRVNVIKLDNFQIQQRKNYNCVIFNIFRLCFIPSFYYLCYSLCY